MTDEIQRPPPETRTLLGEVAPVPGQATRGQRVALVVGLLVVAWLTLQLFASVLAPYSTNVTGSRNSAATLGATSASSPSSVRVR